MRNVNKSTNKELNQSANFGTFKYDKRTYSDTTPKDFKSHTTKKSVKSSVISSH